MQDAAQDVPERRGRGRPRKVVMSQPPRPVAAPPAPAPTQPAADAPKRGRGRPRRTTPTAEQMNSDLVRIVEGAEQSGLLPMMRRDPAARFAVEPGTMPDLSGYDLPMLADAISAMLGAGTNEALGRKRASETLRLAHGGKWADKERDRHVDAAHALVLHEGQRIALGDMADKRYAAAVFHQQLLAIYRQAMRADSFERTAGVALKAATLAAKVWGIDVDSMRIDIKAEVQVEHSDPVRDAIVQRLMAMKAAGVRVVDVGGDD